MTCTHCHADMFTCQGYLTLVSAPGTLPVVYACYPSCYGLPLTQGALLPVLPPAPARWRDRETDPPPIPDESATEETAILVVISPDLDLNLRRFAVVLYWWPQQQQWLTMAGIEQTWTIWQPIVLPESEVSHV